MNFCHKLFLAIGSVIRSLPPIRGKVRFGQFCYKKLNPNQDLFAIKCKLFPERLIFQLNLNCAHERMAYLMGHYENETSLFLAKLYRQGTVLDVGANIGLITLPLATRTMENVDNKKPHIYAIEIIPGNYRALCKNIEFNDLVMSVKPINIGLGKTENEVFIQIEGNDPSSTGTANILPNDRNFVKVPVQINSIDSMVASGQLPDDVSLIKIDTDGYDYEVLKGARQVLKRNGPLIFAELSEHCLNWHGYGVEDVATYLNAIDYDTWIKKRLDPPSFSIYASNRDYKQDCLLVPRERIRDFEDYLYVDS